MKTVLKTSLVTFIVVFGLGYWLFVPSSVEIARKKYYNECKARYTNFPPSYWKNGIEGGCYLLAKEKFK